MKHVGIQIKDKKIIKELIIIQQKELTIEKVKNVKFKDDIEGLKIKIEKYKNKASNLFYVETQLGSAINKLENSTEIIKQKKLNIDILKEKVAEEVVLPYQTTTYIQEIRNTMERTHKIVKKMLDNLMFKGREILDGKVEEYRLSVPWYNKRHNSGYNIYITDRIKVDLKIKIIRKPDGDENYYKNYIILEDVNLFELIFNKDFKLFETLGTNITREQALEYNTIENMIILFFGKLKEEEVIEG